MLLGAGSLSKYCQRTDVGGPIMEVSVLFQRVCDLDDVGGIVEWMKSLISMDNG